MTASVAARCDVEAGLGPNNDGVGLGKDLHELIDRFTISAGERRQTHEGCAQFVRALEACPGSTWQARWDHFEHAIWPRWIADDGELLVQSGLRIEEANELTTLDILKRQLADGRVYYLLHIKPSKFDRARVIPIGDGLGRVIAEIIRHVKRFYGRAWSVQRVSWRRQSP
jgi:hypothetical protein